MKKLLFAFILILNGATPSWSQTFSFDGREKNAIQVNPTDTFTTERGYGYDFREVVEKARNMQTETYQLAPFITYFSVKVPDGNYRVTVTLGNKKKKACTTVRAEARRLYVENAETKKGEFKTYTFTVNKRDDIIRTPDNKQSYVRTKSKGGKELVWDDCLTLEFNGNVPALSSIQITPAEDAHTIWLCGNSTVVDQDCEPWASWGQMIPRWFSDKVAIANYAESGETATSFLAEGRLKKMLTLMKEGDYLMIEFGHNDQKEKYLGSGAFYNFAYALKQFVDAAREKNVRPIFITPTQRRFFDENGRIKETHDNYPEAMRWVAKDLKVPVIELHEMTRTFYETLGMEGSRKAFVQYPAGTFPGQDKNLEDNTHFNAYGAYEIAKMVVNGIIELQLPIAEFLRPEAVQYSPSKPDDVDSFQWPYSPFLEMTKPAGN